MTYTWLRVHYFAAKVSGCTQMYVLLLLFYTRANVYYVYGLALRIIYPYYIMYVPIRARKTFRRIVRASSRVRAAVVDLYFLYTVRHRQ